MITVIPNEVWKAIEGFDGRYQISNLGRCKRLACVNPRWNTHMPDRLLLANPNGDGYLRYTLFYKDSSGRKNAFLHKLVATAFIPNPDNLPEVNHIDGVILNNAIDNLEWITTGDNQKHAYAIGLKDRGRGDKNPNFISRIAAFDAGGVQVACFDGVLDMREKGFTPCCVYDCVTGKQKTYKTLTYKRI